MTKTTASKPTARSSTTHLPKYRFVVISVLWVTAVFLYFDRANISMAAPHIMADLSLTGVEMGLILSMFSWGYVPGQLLGGYVADRFGIRRWSLFWYLVWCISTFATGLGQTLGQLLGARFLFGFSEGTVVNQVNKMQNHWVFPKERGFANGGTMFAAYGGLVLGVPLVAWLIEAVGWQGMFFVSGAATLIGVVLYWWYVYDYPKDHPRISQLERDALEDALAKDRVSISSGESSDAEVSFKDNFNWLIRNPIYWAMFGSFFFLNMIYYTNFSWLPSYLQMERGFSNVGSGVALILPYLAAAIGALGAGILSDKLNNRTLIIILGSLFTMPAIAAMLALDSQTVVIATLCVIMFCNAAAVSTYVVLLFDLFPPQIVGTALAGLAGLSGGFGGIAGPMMMGYSYDLTGSFYTGFAVLGGGMLVSLALIGYVYGHEKRIKLAKAAAETSAAIER